MTDYSIPPTVMIDWNDKKAMWIWVIVGQIKENEPVVVFSVGGNEDRKTAEAEAHEALRKKEWLSA